MSSLQPKRYSPVKYASIVYLETLLEPLSCDVNFAKGLIGRRVRSIVLDFLINTDLPRLIAVKQWRKWLISWYLCLNTANLHERIREREEEKVQDGLREERQFHPRRKTFLGSVISFTISCENIYIRSVCVYLVLHACEIVHLIDSSPNIFLLPLNADTRKLINVEFLNREKMAFRKHETTKRSLLLFSICTYIGVTIQISRDNLLYTVRNFHMPRLQNNTHIH